jgi:hypothetical protein
LGFRTRTIIVWGLRGKADVRVEGRAVEIQLENPTDAAFVDGFVAGLLDMPRLDFARRLWSGRLAEFLGVADFPGPGELNSVRLDVALRGLGFRRRTERAFRALTEVDRRTAEAWATGVNAWIDQSDLPQSPIYRRLGSRPRLMGAADALLLQRAPREVDYTLPPDDSDWGARARATWAALSSAALRAPGAVGDCPDVPLLGTHIGAAAPPRITPRIVLDRDDRHLFVDPAAPEDRPRRLFVDRPDLAVRGEPRRRPWIRRTPKGWLLSDALQDADDALPPVGPAEVFEWPTSIDLAPTPDATIHEPLPETHPWRIHHAEPIRRTRLELIPKRG